MDSAALEAEKTRLVAQVEADEAEFASLDQRMVNAATDGENEEWQRLHTLRATLPTRIHGMKLRAISVRILIGEKKVEADEAEYVRTRDELAPIAQKYEQAKKEFSEARWLTEGTYQTLQSARSDLVAMHRARSDEQEAFDRAHKPRR